MNYLIEDISKNLNDRRKKKSKIEVYDKVSWHYPEGKNCPSLAAAKKHFVVIMKWLKTNSLLSNEGEELLKLGIDDDFAITSSMLNETGNRCLKENYSKWLKSLSYSGAINLRIFDDWIRKHN